MEALNDLAEMIANTEEGQLVEYRDNYDAVIENLNTNNKMINEIREELYRQHTTEDDLMFMKEDVIKFMTDLKETHKESQIKTELLEKMEKATIRTIDTLILEGLEPIIPIKVLPISKDARVPEYVHEGDAGMDLYTIQDQVIEAGKTAIVPTGLKVIIPQGYEIQVRPRSGMSVKTGIRIANAPGTIDSNYRGEIGVIATNTAAESYEIKKGDRIAQIVLQKVPKMKMEVIEDVMAFNDNTTARNEKGFGSSGF